MMQIKYIRRVKEWILVLAALATIICACPVIKEWISSSPGVIVLLGNTPLEDTEEVKLFYLFEDCALQKYRIPLPFSIYNEGAVEVTNASIYISTEMKAVLNMEDRYMKRLVGGNEVRRDTKQYIQLSKIDLPSKGYLSLGEYSFNFVNEFPEQRDDRIWDSFHCDFILSHDHIKHTKQLRMSVYCLFVEDRVELERYIKEKNYECPVYLIYADKDYDKNEHGVPIRVCKLGEIYKIENH